MAASRFATFLESFDRDPKTRGTQWEHVCKWFMDAPPYVATASRRRSDEKHPWLFPPESPFLFPDDRRSSCMTRRTTNA